MPTTPDGPKILSRSWTRLVASSLVLLCGGAQAQSTQTPPAADRRVEYQIDAVRLSVPLAFHDPQRWSDPPKGNNFRRFPNALDVVLMWPKLADATDPAAQRCLEPGMRMLCRDAVDISVTVRSPQAEQVDQNLKRAANPAVVGTLYGFEVSRQTAPIAGPAGRFQRVYLKAVGPDIGDPGKIEGYCGGGWREAPPETLPEIERQLLSCLFHWYWQDNIRVTIRTFAQGFVRWKELYARVEGLLREWQRAAVP